MRATRASGLLLAICGLALLAWRPLHRLHAQPRLTPSAAPAAPVVLLLQLPGCESELLVEQLLVPVLRRTLGGAAEAGAASAICRVGSPDWKARCIGSDGFLQPSVRALVSPHLRIARRSRRPPLVLVPLRDPLERLVEAFNRRHGERRARGGGEGPLANYSSPLVQFAREYRASAAPHNPLACLLAGEAPAACGTGGGKAAAVEARRWPSDDQWMRRARAALSTASVVLLDSYEASRAAACREMCRELGGPAEPRGTAEGSRAQAAAAAADRFCASLELQVPLGLRATGYRLSPAPGHK